MPPAPIPTPDIDIEEGIYKAFASFGKEQQIKIADFLNRLNLEELLRKKYRKIRCSYESLLKLILFKELKGIRFQTQLERYLKSKKEERLKLRFKEIPNQRTVSYFVNHILDSETKRLINLIVKKIQEISEKFGIIFDIEPIKVEKAKKKVSKENFNVKKSKKTREVCKFLKRRLSPFVNLNMGINARYKKNNFLDLLMHLGITDDFAENGSHTLKFQRSDVPDADTLLYHLKRYSSVDQILRMFNLLSEITFEQARKQNLFPRKVDIAIDLTDWFFYGDPNAPMVVEKKPERGTTHCYRFATVNIVEAENRFTLLALPVGPFDRKKDILRKLLSYAFGRVKIRKLYIDRGFFSAECINLVNEFRVKYLMPATQISTIRDVMRFMPTPSIVKDFQMGLARFNLIIVTNEKGVKLAFATNEDYDESDLGLSQRLLDLYGKRWGIETSYRVKKHSFRPQTTSKNYFIRLFYFLWSCLLYNLWILADILIAFFLTGRKQRKRLIASKLFGTVLYSVDLGG
jgi:putative transposase